ncbi:MAG: glycosyltransferase family 4 protein [Saccharothrix sp.]|nr:glycosyltransferase family 4 protein [Saccharothrix sp.]
MKVLVLAPAYHPQTGGAETYARVVASGLHERGHDVVVATDGRPGLAGADTVDGVPVHRFSTYRELLADESKLPWEQLAFSLLPELSGVIEAHGVPDVVLANSHEAAILASVVGAEHPGTAVVATYHQQDRERGPLGVGRSRLVYGLLPIDGFLVGSRYYRQKALTFGASPQRVHHIPHGVDTTAFTGEPRRRTDSRLRLLLAGRIAPRKQQAFMVDVLAGLLREGVDADLTLAGSVHSSTKDYAASVERRIGELGLAERVHTVSDVRNDDMVRLYGRADVVVQPSTEEGLGLAVLEAMACAVPVVVSDTVGLEEIVTSHDVGLRADVGDLTGWVAQLAALAADEDRRLRLAANGRDHVRTGFDQRVMLDGTEKTLLGLLGLRGDARADET